MKFIKTVLCGALLSASLFFGGAYLKAEEPKVESPKLEQVEQNSDVNLNIHELETLFILMQERLNLMHDIAKYKWSHHMQDKTLEGEILTSNNKAIQPFLTAQNKAAQQILNQDFSIYSKEEISQFDSGKDYKTELLPQLKELNSKIVSNAQLLMTEMQEETLPGFLKDISFNSFKQEGIERGIYDTAVAPLFQH